MKNKFCERLKELREEKNLSQRSLAKELGISQAAIARWEANLQTPSIDTAISLAMYFKVTIDCLVGLEE